MRKSVVLTLNLLGLLLTLLAFFATGPTQISQVASYAFGFGWPVAGAFVSHGIGVLISPSGDCDRVSGYLMFGALFLWFVYFMF